MLANGPSETQFRSPEPFPPNPRMGSKMGDELIWRLLLWVSSSSSQYLVYGLGKRGKFRDGEVLTVDHLYNYIAFATKVHAQA